MFIVEKRLGVSFGIQLDSSNVLNSECLKHWLAPFFLIQDRFSDNIILLAKINVCNKSDREYDYVNHEFYVCSELADKMIYYNIMFISRVVFKCIAGLLGYQNLHAGCLAFDGNGILVTGERNQGKTTVILRALEKSGFTLVANDQIMFAKSSKIALGYPAAIGIRSGSCSKHLQSEIIRHALSMSEDPFQIDKKPIIHINELKKIVHCNVESTAKVTIALKYEKSDINDELIISQPFECQDSLKNLVLPIANTYSSEIYSMCMDSISHYFQSWNKIEESSCDLELKFIRVKCGISRINDMLAEIIKII